MKKFLRKIVFFLLKRMAKSRLKKFKGKIIAITGSAGKTSTKEAIYTVLNSQFKVKKSEKNMNTEFGLILTILDIESGFSSAFKWSWLIFKAFYNSFFVEHSEILLLEFGVDKKGDMDELISVVKPDIAVITNIFPVHLEADQFSDLQSIFDEKKKIVEGLNEGGIAILNIDNSFLAHYAKRRGKSHTITFGKDKEASYFAEKIKQSIDGINFVIRHEDKKFEVQAEVLGEHQVYVLMPAIICAEIMRMDLSVALDALKRYSLPPGRMTIIPGKNDSIILDSSYNSSPEALKESLKILKEVGCENRKVAVLGNMNELGDQSKILHEMIGEIIPLYADMLLTVGENAKLFAENSEEHGMKKTNIHVFKTATDASDFFQNHIKKNDVVLVKGSQNGVRLERFVKALMENPLDAKNLLVRQDKSWEIKI